MDVTYEDLVELLAPAYARTRGTTTSTSVVLPTSSFFWRDPSLTYLGIVDRNPLAVAVRRGDDTAVLRLYPSGALEFTPLVGPVGIATLDAEARRAHVESDAAARAIALPAGIVAVRVEGCFGGSLTAYQREKVFGLFSRWSRVGDASVDARLSALLGGPGQARAQQ